MIRDPELLNQLVDTIARFVRERLIPNGEHLTKKCRHWTVRREMEIGWCPEVA